MEDELKANFQDISIDLIRGDGGVFEIKVDGTLIFSKISGSNPAYRFPSDGEISNLIKKM